MSIHFENDLHNNSTINFTDECASIHNFLISNSDQIGKIMKRYNSFEDNKNKDIFVMALAVTALSWKMQADLNQIGPHELCKRILSAKEKTDAGC